MKCDSVIPGQRDREGVPPRVQPEISEYAGNAKRKLDHIQAAAALTDLGAIPGNRLEVLCGDRKGQYSIRVNDQWRICFRWAGTDALDVEIVDYH
jgi:proteic killer suppression protein